MNSEKHNDDDDDDAATPNCRCRSNVTIIHFRSPCCHLHFRSAVSLCSPVDYIINGCLISELAPVKSRLPSFRSPHANIVSWLWFMGDNCCWNVTVRTLFFAFNCKRYNGHEILPSRSWAETCCLVWLYFFAITVTWLLSLFIWRHYWHFLQSK